MDCFFGVDAFMRGAETQSFAQAARRMRAATTSAAGAGAAQPRAACVVAAITFVCRFLRIIAAVAFSINWAAFAIFMGLIGGIGRIEGPVVGALIFRALNKFFSGYGT